MDYSNNPEDIEYDPQALGFGGDDDFSDLGGLAEMRSAFNVERTIRPIGKGENADKMSLIKNNKVRGNPATPGALPPRPSSVNRNSSSPYYTGGSPSSLGASASLPSLHHHSSSNTDLFSSFTLESIAKYYDEPQQNSFLSHSSNPFNSDSNHTISDFSDFHSPNGHSLTYGNGTPSSEFYTTTASRTPRNKSAPSLPAPSSSSRPSSSHPTRPLSSHSLSTRSKVPQGKKPGPVKGKLGSLSGGGSRSSPSSHNSSLQLSNSVNHEYLSKAIEMDAATLDTMMQSPRFQEACERQGIMLDELKIKPFESFAEPGLLQDIQRKRFDHFETKRTDKLKDVLAERDKVISENSKPPVWVFESLALMESLMDKEARRLEKELKSQMKVQSAKEAESSQILKKQADFQRRMEEVNKREAEIKKKVEDKVKEQKKKADEKQKKIQDVLVKMKTVEDERYKDSIKRRQEEEEKFQELMAAKKYKDSQKEHVWRQKQEERERKRIEAEKYKELRSAEVINRYEQKMQQLEVLKEEREKETEVKKEDTRLKLADRQENVKRLQRMEEYKKRKMVEKLAQEEERLRTIEKLKGALQEQRKSKSKELAVKKTISLIKHLAPGPGEYGTPEYAADSPGVLITGFRSRSPQEIAADRASLLPGPGEYQPTLSKDTPSIGFGKGNVPSMLDLVARQSKQTPGPGAYNVIPSPTNQRHTSPPRSSSPLKGAPSELDIAIRHAAEVPGPGAYHGHMERKNSMTLPTIRAALNMHPDIEKALLANSQSRPNQ
eukprot:GILI01009208.1.p1 GENE.GILI01009208.1~~GILI01009208.1.p1  ORF type:complete len:776 (+),score=156.71 GILI01009208.1:112-2439(+)